MSGPHPPDADRIAFALTVMELMGGRAAADHLKMPESTLYAWRARYATRPDIVEIKSAYKKEARTKHQDMLALARVRFLMRGLELAGKEENLRDVMGAYKIASDAAVAERVVEHGLGLDSAGESPEDATLEGVAGTNGSQAPGAIRH